MATHDDIKKFLEDFTVKIKNLQSDDKNKAKYSGLLFNMFEITDISEKEVFMCKFLAELLNPNGKHYQGTKYLDLFYERFLQSKAPDLETKNVKIETESITNYIENDKRRIDILILEKGKYYIPIEVKINADEQPEQCEEYLLQTEEYYKKYNLINERTPFLCFLTKSGKEAESTNKKEQVVRISWNDIIKWLNDCIYNENTLQINTLLVTLMQYREAINIFMGDNNKMDNEKLKLLAKNLEIVKDIAENYENVKKEIWNKFGEEIQTHKEIGRNNPRFIKSDWLIAYRNGDEDNNGIALYNVISRENNGDINILQAKYRKKGSKIYYEKDQKCIDKETLTNIETLSAIYSENENFSIISKKCIEHLKKQ